MKTKTLIFTLSLFSVLVIVFGRCNDDPEPLIIPANCIADIDRNIYKTVTIGSQVWMAENLKVTRYRNGDKLTNGNNSEVLSYGLEGAYFDYNNMQANTDIVGKLYNGYAIKDKRNIAPEGWHIPSDIEWSTLVDYLGGVEVAGGKLKDTSAYWYPPNEGATNETGFSALPGGYCATHPFLYSAAKYFGYFWTSTDADSIFMKYRVMFHNSESVVIGKTKYGTGLSVRCVKD